MVTSHTALYFKHGKRTRDAPEDQLSHACMHARHMLSFRQIICQIFKNTIWRHFVKLNFHQIFRSYGNKVLWFTENVELC